MRKIGLLFLLGFLFVGVGLAENKSTTTPKKPIISVSILPQKFFVEQIAGDFLQVNVILPPGSSPEDFEPTPRQIQSVSNSTFYFYIGHLGFEKAWVKKVLEVSPGVTFVSCSKGIDLLDDECTHIEESHAKSEMRGTDPHIWTSPENVKTISRTICGELTQAYPEKKALFEKNLGAFISRIDSLDNHIRLLLNDSIRTSFMIFHPALAYFARDYHLRQHTIEYDGKSPSTAHMKKMVDLARKEKINTIFIQSQFETSKAEAIAKEIKAKVVPVNNLGENWLSDMYDTAKKMKEALTIKGHE
jgi:zinc transport system substrate-binding protein